MKNIKLKFDVGAILILKEHGYDMLDMTPEEMQDIQFIATLIYATAIRGGSNITIDDIRNMTFKEFEPLVKQLKAVMDEGMKGVLGEESNTFKFNKKAVMK